jgi:hypothetical protein
MDQLKTQLAVVKQHSFWIMCVGILLVTIGSWWVSTNRLKQEKETRLGEITTSFSGLSTVASTQKHPNEVTNKGMDELNRRYALEVAKGWQRQYDQQAGVLVWSTSFTDRFRKAVDKLRPIEAIPVNNGIVAFSHDIDRDLREEYRNYMEDELPNLAKTIGARWQVSTLGEAGAAGAPMPGGRGEGGGGFGAPGGFGAAGGMPGGFSSPSGLDANGQPMFDDSVVLWDPANQQEILQTHFGFVARANLPSTLEVLYAQEDYWVFDNIMRIIREANKVDEKDGKPVYASARHEAIVKRIDFVRIGRTAMGQAGQIQRLGAALGGEMAGGGEGGMPGGGMPGGGMGGMPMTGSPDGAGGMPGGGGEGGMGGEAMMRLDPAEMRYVDEKYAPLPAARLRGALTSRTPEDALLAVAKRMPVRMRVSLDQRKLNILLAECGNSRLPVEVRQVRINRPAATAGGMGGGGYGMAGGGGFSSGSSDNGGGFGGFGGSPMGGSPLGGGFGGMPGGGEGGYGGMPGIGGGRPAAQAGSLTADANVDPNLVDVELYGIVYIYNPVNKAQLGLDQPAPAVDASGAPAPAPQPGDATPPAEQPPVVEAAQTTPAPAPGTTSSIPATTPTVPAPAAG